MTRRVRCTILAVVLMGGGSSCSSSSSPATTPEPTVSAPNVESAAVVPANEPASSPEPNGRCSPGDTGGDVVMWHTLGGNVAGDVLNSLEAEFNRTHLAHLTTKHVGGEKELLDALAETPAVDWPDIVVTSENTTRALVDTDRFLAPASCDEQLGDDMFPLVRQTYTVDGGLAAMPWGVSLPVLMFNAAKFRDAGLDPSDPPLTLPDLLNDSKQLVQSGTSTHGLVLSDGCANLVLEQFAAKRGQAVGSSDDGHAGRDVSVDFATPDNIADLQALRDGVQTGHVQWMGGNPSGFDDLLNIVVPDGGAVMAIHTAAALGDVIDLLGSGNFPGVELGVGPLPGPGLGSLVGGNALWLVDPNDAVIAGRAWTVIDWLYQPTQLAKLSAATGYVPPTRSATQQQLLLDRWAEYPQLRVAYDQMLATAVTTASSGLMIGPSIDFDFILFDACSKIIGGADIETTLRQTSGLVNDIIAGYNAEQNGDETFPTLGQQGSDTPGSALVVGGVVICASGSPVVGVWIESEAGGSGFAERGDDIGGRSSYSYTLPNGGRYRAHVGCGGTEQQWATNNKSDFVSGSQNSFLCNDSAVGESGSGTCELS